VIAQDLGAAPVRRGIERRDLDLAGPAIWSGGADGMNGSLAATGVLLTLVLAAMAAAPRRSA